MTEQKARDWFRQWYLDNKDNLDDNGFPFGLNSAVSEFIKLIRGNHATQEINL
jgi:hypothetical protein